jgi:hypothetical protein
VSGEVLHICASTCNIAESFQKHECWKSPESNFTISTQEQKYNRTSDEERGCCNVAGLIPTRPSFGRLPPGRPTTMLLNIILSYDATALRLRKDWE